MDFIEKKINIGFKIRSTETGKLDDIILLHDEGNIDYIELYVVPKSFDKTIAKWISLEIPKIIHAPHSLHGVNLADKNYRNSNLIVFDEVKKFANKLSAEIIIVHAGCNGTISEVCNQLKQINDPRLSIENKPFRGINGEECIGYSIDQIKEIFKNDVVRGCVLDFGHAVYAANSLHMDKIEFIKLFMKFQPNVFHLTDGLSNSEKDIHLNLGMGDFNLKQFVSVIPNNGMVTLETPRSLNNGIQDYKNDISFLKSILEN